MAWNKPVTKQRYEAIHIAIQKSGLKFDGRKTWDKNWKAVTVETWKKLSEIPEFSAEISKQISGLDTLPTGDSESKKKAAELRQKADELLTQAKELEESL